MKKSVLRLRLCSARAQTDRGAVFVETALIAPALLITGLLFLLFVVEASRLGLARIFIGQAASEIGRVIQDQPRLDAATLNTEISNVLNRITLIPSASKLIDIKSSTTAPSTTWTKSFGGAGTLRDSGSGLAQDVYIGLVLLLPLRFPQMDT